MSKRKQLADSIFEESKREVSQLRAVDEILFIDVLEQGFTPGQWRTDYGYSKFLLDVNFAIGLTNFPDFYKLVGRRIFSISAQFNMVTDPTNLVQYSFCKMGSEEIILEPNGASPEKPLSSLLSKSLQKFYVLGANDFLRIRVPYMAQLKTAAPAVTENIQTRISWGFKFSYVP